MVWNWYVSSKMNLDVQRNLFNWWLQVIHWILWIFNFEILEFCLCRSDLFAFIWEKSDVSRECYARLLVCLLIPLPIFFELGLKIRLDRTARDWQNQCERTSVCIHLLISNFKIELPTTTPPPTTSKYKKAPPTSWY